MNVALRDHPARPPAVAGLAAVAWSPLGAGVGVGGAVLAQVAPWPLSALPHYAAPYVLLLVLIGVSASTRRSAALAATGCFVTFVAAYYFVVWIQFGAVPVVYAGGWALAALTVCPAAAAVVRRARSRSRGGLYPAGVSAAAGAVALSDGAAGNLVRIAAGRGDGASGQPLLALTDLLVAAVVLVVVPHGRRTRWLAIALLVPFAIVATYIGWTVHFGPGPYL